MFSGIVESLGEVVSVEVSGNNKNFVISSQITPELKIDQSISHNGVCLTVVDINNMNYTVTAVDETLEVSNLGELQNGDMVNLERSIKLSDRLDGHLVQGHVDDTTELIQVVEENGSWRFRFKIPTGGEGLMVYKGSICINGVSLTIATLESDYFEVAIIPYTFENTNFNKLGKNSTVNIEYDILGKYILRNLELQK